jgi:anti-anti-sigma regulatory factor
MSGAILDRQHGPFSAGAPQMKALPVVSLLVYLRHDAQNCRATFIGALTTDTRATIDGVVDLIAGEPSVVLDLSRVEVVDQSGADALAVLVDSVRARGGRFRMVETNRPSAEAALMGRSLTGSAPRARGAPVT